MVDTKSQNYSAVLQRTLEKAMLANFDRSVELELELYPKKEPEMKDFVGRLAAIASIDRYPVPLYPLYPYNYSLNVCALVLHFIYITCVFYLRMVKQ